MISISQPGALVKTCYFILFSCGSKSTTFTHHPRTMLPKTYQNATVKSLLLWSWAETTREAQPNSPRIKYHMAICTNKKKHTLQIQSPENGNDGTYSKYYAFYFGDWDTPIILWSIWRLMPRDTHAHTHTQKKTTNSDYRMILILQHHWPGIQSGRNPTSHISNVLMGDWLPA